MSLATVGIAVVALLSVIQVVEADRVASWKSALNFRPDFERDWPAAGVEVDGPRPKEISRGFAKESLRGIVNDEPVKATGKLASKNCFFSPVQCSFFYKRNFALEMPLLKKRK